MQEDILEGKDNTQEYGLWGILEKPSWSLKQPLSKVALLLGIFISMTKNFFIVGDCVAWDQQASYGHSVPLAYSLVSRLNTKHPTLSRGLKDMIPSSCHCFGRS